MQLLKRCLLASKGKPILTCKGSECINKLYWPCPVTPEPPPTLPVGLGALFQPSLGTPFPAPVMLQACWSPASLIPALLGHVTALSWGNTWPLLLYDSTFWCPEKHLVDIDRVQILPYSYISETVILKEWHPYRFLQSLKVTVILLRMLLSILVVPLDSHGLHPFSKKYGFQLRKRREARFWFL